MRAPEFWDRADNSWSRLLAPLAALYAIGGVASRRFKSTHSVGVPVFCVGNLVAGGAGKTPVVIDLLRRLRALGLRPHALSRGYGGSEVGPARVVSGHAGVFGDEPLLLAREAPAWVARDRLAGARRAVSEGAGAIVMDDGFQNPALAKDCSLLVVDGQYGFGNGRVIPAGPLREPVEDGIARADALVIMGEDEAGVAQSAGGKTILKASLKPYDDGTWRGRRVVAFAGIARPAKFFRTLRSVGAEILSEHVFPDHHPYLRSEMDGLIRDAERLKADLVTTEKDWVRLPSGIAERVRSLPVDVAWADGGAGIEALLRRYAGGRA